MHIRAHSANRRQACIWSSPQHRKPAAITQVAKPPTKHVSSTQRTGGASDSTCAASPSSRCWQPVLRRLLRISCGEEGRPALSRLWGGRAQGLFMGLLQCTLGQAQSLRHTSAEHATPAPPATPTTPLTQSRRIKPQPKAGAPAGCQAALPQGPAGPYCR